MCLTSLDPNFLVSLEDCFWSSVWLCTKAEDVLLSGYLSRYQTYAGSCPLAELVVMVVFW